MNKLIKAIKNPKLAFQVIRLKCLSGKRGQKLDDKTYLKKKYKIIMSKKLNLDNPHTFNEKLQWLKLYDRKPIYTTMVDKYAAKKYVADIIGEEYIIPTLGVWNSFDEIDFDSLPNQFVLKCTHNSGLGMCICKDKTKLDKEKIRQEFVDGLKQDYYLQHREWPYKDVPRRIIAEKYMVDDSNGLVDYKFFCFNGFVDCVMVCMDRHIHDTKFYFFDKEWKLKKYNYTGQNASQSFTLRKPKCIDKMFEIASILSQNLHFARIDLYESFDRIYFGEITFFPDSGFDKNILPNANIYLGSLIDISSVEGINK